MPVEITPVKKIIVHHVNIFAERSQTIANCLPKYSILLFPYSYVANHCKQDRKMQYRTNCLYFLFAVTRNLLRIDVKDFFLHVLKLFAVKLSLTVIYCLQRCCSCMEISQDWWKSRLYNPQHRINSIFFLQYSVPKTSGKAVSHLQCKLYTDKMWKK